MTLSRDESNEVRRNPINREKYVIDKTRYQSKSKAVRVQKPYLSPGKASSLASQLEKEPIVKQLSQGVEEVLVGLNKRRFEKLRQLLDSDNEKVSMLAVKEVGNVVENYTDRVKGKAKTTVENISTHLSISLDFSGSAASQERINPESVIEGEEVKDE